MHGVRPVVLLRWNSFHSRLLTIGPVEQPHMLYCSLTCSTHQKSRVLGHGTNPFSSLFLWFLPLKAVLLHWTLLSCPDKHNGSRTCFEGGRSLQFNCNGIQLCHNELQDFLDNHHVFVDCVQETKLSMNSTLKEFTGYAILRHLPGWRRWWTSHSR